MQFLRGLFGRRSVEEERQVDVLTEAQARAEQQPGDAGAHFNLGSIYYVRGQVAEAVSALEKAVQLAPDHDDANYMLGLAYAKLGRVDDARRAFQTVHEKADNHMLQSYALQKLRELETRAGAEHSRSGVQQQG